MIALLHVADAAGVQCLQVNTLWYDEHDSTLCIDTVGDDTLATPMDASTAAGFISDAFFTAKSTGGYVDLSSGPLFRYT